MTPVYSPTAAPRLAASVCGIFLTAVACPGALAIDLVSVFQLARSSDPVYQGAGAANRAAQEVKPQARGQLLPNLSANAEIFRNYLDVRESNAVSRTGTDEFTDELYTLSLTQPVYRRDLFIQLGQADTSVQQADAEYAFALQELMLRSANRYFGVLRAQDTLTFARATLDAFEQQLRQSQQRFEVGLIAITDVEEAKAGFDLARAQVIAAENDLNVAREALREVTGEYHRDLATLSQRLVLVTPEPADIDRWTEIALKQNLSLSATRFSSQVARDEIRRQASGHYPTLDIVGNLRRDESTGGFSGGSTFERSDIGVLLNFPIYQGGLVVSRTREARELYRQSLDQVEERRRAVERQTRDAYLGVVSEISRVQALEQAVRSNESARAAIEAGFQVGTRTSVDVLDAERNVFEAKRDLSASRYDFIINTLTLKQAAGTLSEEDLSLINAWLQ
jgi:outer membrane protein